MIVVSLADDEIVPTLEGGGAHLWWKPDHAIVLRYGRHGMISTQYTVNAAAVIRLATEGQIAIDTEDTRGGWHLCTLNKTAPPVAQTTEGR